MKLSQFGQVLAANAPIVQLMDDLGEALNENPDSLFLGGGNPAEVAGAAPIFKQHLDRLNQLAPHAQLGVYQSPQGNWNVLTSVAEYLSGECDWAVGPENIALVGGSQTAFFILFNLFCDNTKKVLLPMVPEYLGYSAQPLGADVFVPTPPLVAHTAPNRFKYQVDFAALAGADAVNLMCVSSPANPSGNVITTEEFVHLNQIARARDIPLVLDYAYGRPFPGLIYGEQQPYWRPGCIAVLSLSKLGLPGVRGAVVVADPQVIDWVARANTIISLAGGNLGSHLLKSLLDSGDMQHLSQHVLPEFYRARRDHLVRELDRQLALFPYKIHEPEGAFFIWLWLQDLPISARELYQKLKARGVIVMPGEAFFFGLDETLEHAKQCLRLSYCQPEEVLSEAVAIMAQELAQLYG